MSIPSASPRIHPKVRIVVIAVALATVLGFFAWVGLGAPVGTHSSPSTPAPPGGAPSGGSLSVFSHTGTVNHAGAVSRGVSGTYGPASVFSHTGTVGSGPNTTTSSLSVRAGSRVFVFVGYVNAEIGGGSVRWVADSLGDVYSLVLTSGSGANHTEDLYESGPVPSNASLTVSAGFGDGNLTMGGTVAAVDVVTSVGTPTVDVVYSQRGTGDVASVLTTTTLTLDLLLLGVTAPEPAAPFVAGPGETRLDTAGGATGPGADSEGFGTFMAPTNGTVNNLSASLATPQGWAAIGVGIYGLNESARSLGTTTTPPFSVASGSVVFLFVGYVNAVAGGGGVGQVNDTLGDSFTAIASTGLQQNHTEVLYVSSVIRSSASTTVTVGFVGGDTPMGGSVAAVDVVASSGQPVVNGTNTQTGSWSGTASVSVAADRTSALLLLGVSGMGRAAPFAKTGNETLLDTGTNTSGPWFDGTGFGTFSARPTGDATTLTATLNTPAEWGAIGVGISSVGHPLPKDTGSVRAPYVGLGAMGLFVAGAHRPKRLPS